MKPYAFAVGICMFLAGCGGEGGAPDRTSGGGSGSAPAIALTQVATGFTAPLAIESARDGSGRLFVLEQAGRIRILQNGVTFSTPFLNITTLVTSGGERGLLGLAFHPNYAGNRKFYINYTRTVSGQLQTAIVEYLASTIDPNVADPASARILLTYNQPFANHNGGQLAFGPDGFLYIGAGDGGGSGDPNDNAQNTNTVLGKILRIDVNATSPGKQYAIPATNPFANGVGGAPEVYAWGFRNPWRFSFDTNRLFVGDVGEGGFEEVSLVEIGRNYGWNTMEGTHCFSPATSCSQAGLTLPITDYAHSEGESVTAGYVYRGNAVPALTGFYIFGDFISGRVWVLSQNGSTWARTQGLATGRNISSFGQDQNGEIYLVDYSGSIHRVVAQ